MGQKLANRICGPDDNTIIIARLHKNDHDLSLSGRINGEWRVITIDTGAMKSILRPDIANVRLFGSSNYVLRTATGEAVPVLGEVNRKVQLGDLEFRHDFLVANITDECIIGMDFLKAHGFSLDFKERLLKWQNVEVPIEITHMEAKRLRVIIDSNTTISPLSESLISAKIDGNPQGHRFYLVEPTKTPAVKNLMLARILIKPRDDNVIPIRVLNTSERPVAIKQGDVIGLCEPVATITRLESSEMKAEVPLRQVSTEVLEPNRLPAEEYQKAANLVDEFSDVFAESSDDRGRTKLVTHRINTGDSKPIRQAPRRLPLAKQPEVDKMMADMEKQGIIEPSNSPWRSPVVLVKKKDGSTRFCVDYRQLNDVTKKDNYPLPRIDDIMDTLAGSVWFSTLDLISGYWQVEIEESDREKTAFSVGSGLWQFVVMPFGLCNAPATFERLMECVLRGLSWQICLVYLDDIIVIGRSFEEHLKNLREVFLRLRSANLKLSPKKCTLFAKEVKYLGHTVSADGIKTDPDKIKAIKDWPTPKDKRQLRSFLGLATYYRRFVKGFAQIAKCLHQLTEKHRPYKWDEQCQNAFDTLKAKLIEAPMLEYPRPGVTFTIDTDASNIGIGAVLSQEVDGEERPISFYSRVLSKSERNYCVTRRELLAVVEATKHYHKYLYGQKFIVRTDHGALRWLLNFKNPEGQIARWIERLQAYDFEIVHRKGRTHSNADALSRRPCPQDCKHCWKTEHKATEIEVNALAVEPEIGWSAEEIRKAQLDDEDIGLIITAKEKSQRPAWADISDKSATLKSYWAQWDSLHIENGVLKRKWESPDGQQHRMQLLLPRSRVKEVLAELHEGATGGHLGVNKTLAKVRERFYWMHAREDVEDWCRKCHACASVKGPKHKPRGKMQLYNVGVPFERIAIDVAGPFPETNDGNRYTLVISDYFSKWPEVYAIPNQEATTIAEQLVFNWISRYGVPNEIHSDQGRNFESQIFSEMCNLLGIRKTRTTPLHPQSDGMVERFNKTLKDHLAKVVSENQRDWDRHIPIFLMAYRSAEHSTTGESPATVIFGNNIRMPADLKFGTPPGYSGIMSEYVSELKNKLNYVHHLVRKRLRITSDRMKTRYDRRANTAGFQADDLVWLYNPKRQKGLSPKLQADWEGPYLVITRINDVVYRIQRHGKPRAKMKVVHIDRLAPYTANDPTH